MNNVKAIKEIFTEVPSFTIACKSRLVAAMMRISTFYGLMAANPFKFPFLQNA
ncbi:Uncharacterised protein [Escherichia coli]|uniref:Uncharacterized protein n=1 Tax=Escherichia coli TaxID=562 RepID=A0A376VGJ4_ECOLX|nr:Uncharacterised protein [Escherichia coli]